LILSFVSRVWGSSGEQSGVGGKAVAAGKGAVEEAAAEAQTTAVEDFAFFVTSSIRTDLMSFILFS
jgi:hypothetical protein